MEGGRYESLWRERKEKLQLQFPFPVQGVGLAPTSCCNLPCGATCCTARVTHLVGTFTRGPVGTRSSRLGPHHCALPSKATPKEARDLLPHVSPHAWPQLQKCAWRAGRGARTLVVAPKSPTLGGQSKFLPTTLSQPRPQHVHIYTYEFTHILTPLSYTAHSHTHSLTLLTLTSMATHCLFSL